MKTLLNIVIITILIAFTKLQAQDFQGLAIYKSHRKIDFEDDKNDGKSAFRKQLMEQISLQSQNEYTLTFNKNESLYKKNEKLGAPITSSGGIKVTVSDGSDLIYKNIKENRYTNKTELYGKQFLIKDSLKNNHWELVNETKNIGEYTCFKATFSEAYTTKTISSEGKLESVTKDQTTIAWYTPQIPISNGPSEFNSLPGLILEVNDGELTLVCTKIVLNPKEKVEIVEPKKGKEVNQKEFDDIMEKKNKEMMDHEDWRLILRQF